MSLSKTQKEAIIVGAGLVGCQMAILLAKDGWKVKLFEKYRDPRDKKPECTRSINLTWSRRGKDAFKAVNLLAEVEAMTMPAYGRVVYDKTGRQVGSSMYGENGESIGSIQRFELNLLLLNAANAMANVQVFFQQELIYCNFETGVLTIRSFPDGSPVDEEFQADLIVGADGAHSAMRCEMLKQRKLEVMEFKYHDHGYMEMLIPTTSDGEYQMAKDRLHIFPKDTFTLICLPNKGGTFSGTLVMPFTLFQQALTSPETLIDFFQTNFPSVLEMVGEKGLIKQFKPGQDDRRTACSLASLKCQKYHVSNTEKKSNVVLIGDAAHAMPPFYGMGMNTGLEDCLVLMDKLQTHGCQTPANIARALEDFSETRCKDGQAMTEFSYRHYAALCHKVKGSKYSIRRHLDSMFHRLFKSSWVPEYTMIAFSRTPFSQCRAECDRQDKIINRCVWSLALIVLVVAIIVMVFALK